MFPQDPSEPQSRLPAEVKSCIVECLRQAYDMALDVRASYPIIGKFGHAPMATGNLIYWLANNLICEAVKENRLPGKAAFKPVEHGGAEYMEYWYDGVSITLARVAESHKTPRKSNFRINRAYGNQAVMDFMAPGGEQEPSLVLVHGHKSLTFAHLIMPGFIDGNISVLHRSDNLVGSASASISIETLQDACEIDEFGLSLRPEYLAGKAVNS